MSKEEKLAAVPVLHSEGNRLVLQKDFQRAAEKYQEAVICLRNLQAKTMPRPISSGRRRTQPCGTNERHGRISYVWPTSTPPWRPPSRRS